jgi:DNA-directed RNA polymerase subunit K/omega
MSDTEYPSEEEEEELDDDDEEENERHTSTTHNKGSKPLTPLTFGRTFTNQHRIKSDNHEEDGVIEEEEDDDEEEDEDGMAENDDDEEEDEDDDNPEEEEEEEEEEGQQKAKSGSTNKTAGGKGKRKRSKKEDGDGSDTDSDEGEGNHSSDEVEMDEEEEGDEDDDDGDPERYMHKFEKDLTKEYILDTHPECIPVNMTEVRAMLPVIRNEDGIIVDDFHRTLPIVTKYEKARIIGQRAMQLNSGATPYIPVENLIDGTTIAELEFEQKKIPVIIKRPLPNGAFEYWRLKDLEILY